MKHIATALGIHMKRKISKLLQSTIDRKLKVPKLRHSPLVIDRNTKRKHSQYTIRKGKQKKQKMGGGYGVDGRIEEIDRISELPEHVIHHILCLLRCPKDVVRTSVLSKKWRSVWASFLVFDFDQKNFQGRRVAEKGQLKKFIENSLMNRLEPLSCIQKFRLYLTCFDLTLASDMNRWINAATRKNVKELEIHLEVRKKRYSLPRTVFSTTTITSLKLHGCKLDKCSDIKLPKLLELSIKKTNVDKDIIQSFICCCPLIEDFRLVNCSGLECLHVSTLLNLNRVEIHECHGLKSVEIGAPNLLTFWYCGRKRSKQCKINLAGCENLKNLTLTDTNMTDELFQSQISKFPFLEKLVLKKCQSLQRITILSEKLKRLVLIRCRKLEEAIIDAPNLRSFEYTGEKLPFSSMNISGLSEAKLHFEFSEDKKLEFSLEMQKFIGRFDQSKDFKLIIYSEKNVTIHEELGEVQFPSSIDFKLELTKSSMNMEELVEDLLSTYRPNTLSVVGSSSSEFPKFMYEKMRKREENPNCCRYYSRKCWRHFLKDFEASRIFPWTPYFTASSRHPTTSLTLKWNHKPSESCKDHRNMKDGHVPLKV